MIRLTTPDDTTALLALADSLGIFQPKELEELRGMLADYFDGDNNRDRDDIPFWLTDDDNGPVGVAYCAPEQMTNGAWNLLFIAIHPERQGQGRGTALIHSVEKTLKARGARLLLVETSASFEHTRAFYRKCGYEEEGQIRDFYDTGADKIIYRKVLAD